MILDPDNQDPGCEGVRERAFTPSILEYDPTIPARYMVWQNWGIFWVVFWCGQVGTEEGRIVCCSKKAKVQPEVIINTFRGHHGPVRGLQRNPAFSKNFLSVSDWCLVSGY